MRASLIPLAVTLAVASHATNAHHSTAIFDMKADVRITGTITKYEWVNPHVYLWVESVSGNGETVTWEVEGGPPPILRRAGISEDTIAVQPATTLTGTWGTLLDMAAVGAVINPADDLLNERGKQARADILQGKLRDNPVCTPAPIPAIMMAPDIKRIELDDDEVRISREWDGITRRVDMKALTHDGVESSLHGHSIGHWEDDVLVVDTARFTVNPRGNGYTLPSSEQKHVVEKFRLSEDGAHLLYSVVLEDPEYLIRPLVSAEFKWIWRPDLQYQPLPCDPENALRHTR